MSANGASTSDAGVPAKKESKKPKYSKFTQQELPACKPLLTPGWVIAIFMIVGVIFIPIGAVTLLASNGVVEIVHAYHNECTRNLTTREAKIAYIENDQLDKTCNVQLRVTKDMDAPVYVYYQLDNFYQNHRRYVKSRNDQQLRGDSVNETTGCKPEATYNGQPILPCGLIAWSLFNDTYVFTRGGTQGLFVNKKGISWKSDREDKFGSILPSNFPNNQRDNTSLIGGGALNLSQPLNEQEDLIVWMRTAALPTFRKLYGKIEDDLKQGDTISVQIQNNYNTYTFGGGKKLVLSTTSWLGGKNSFLGIAYLTVGILSIFLALVFFLVHLRNPRPLGDPSYLSWNRKAQLTSNSAH
ncbi:hypothetical protein R1sor_022462 [Riccia sorocarpa]|uniref:ALA-interacting subunit n=1 Tax=Riccia sorocarpa TaxID=122646 RepID=A0ABD3GLF9_9MARC